MHCAASGIRQRNNLITKGGAIKRHPLSNEIIMLIPTSILSVLALLATLAMIAKRQYEHAFTRACVVIFYLSLTIMPDIPIETARSLSRWFWSLLLGIEVLGWLLMWCWRKHNEPG